MKGVTALDLENNWIKETSFINSQIKKSGEKALSHIVTEVLGILTCKKKWISLAYVFAALTVTEKKKQRWNKQDFAKGFNPENDKTTILVKKVSLKILWVK